MSLTRLKNSIEEFVDRHLPKEPSKPRYANKIIHESIWGTHLYLNKEIIFLDTPLLQRLRRIHQTGLAYYTFPTAVHSRFDHTLGVINRCSKMIDELLEKPECQELVKNLKPSIRIAALLHDCGHGIFSHTSEEMYRLLDEMKEVITEDQDFNCKPQPHEILSCLIIKSDRFKDFFYKVDPGCDLPTLVKFITGNEELDNKYKAEILNSIFDGDKLDYVHRDAHFCGLPLRIDLDRLWYGISITGIPIKDQVFRKLSISHTATQPLEQIVFHKTMLYPTLYQHQKVRACDCMFKSVIEYLRKREISVTMGHREVTFQNPEDYLWGTDDDFLAIGLYTKDDWLKMRLDDIKTRKLFHRVISISSHNVDESYSAEYARLLTYRGEGSLPAYQELRQTASQICTEAQKKGIDVIPEDIWIDLPEDIRPSKDVEDSYVFIQNDRENGEYSFIPVKDIFPIHNWCRQISLHKWEGHIFCPDGFQEQIAPIAKGVIEEKYGLRFNDGAFFESHVSPPK